MGDVVDVGAIGHGSHATASSESSRSTSSLSSSPPRACPATCRSAWSWWTGQCDGMIEEPGAGTVPGGDGGGWRPKGQPPNRERRTRASRARRRRQARGGPQLILESADYSDRGDL